ncbi:hypothetical protein H4582DRAFT_399309 [Lactarius indigo]|nr:hypothetical protein H4582DRAFT_399309 [Lactarius indigo]
MSLNRIHSTLVVAPTVLRVTAVMTAEIGTTSAPDDPSTVQPPRLCPFQLLYIRQTAKPKVIDDAIVVIGLRQKKHKHAKKAGATDGDSDGEKSTEGRGTDRRSGPVFFDFGSALNILDEGKRNEQDDSRAGRRKQQTYERGDFPAVPKDRREVESGYCISYFPTLTRGFGKMEVLLSVA